MYFSVIISTFSENGRNKKAKLLEDSSFIKYLNDITHGGFQELIKASLVWYSQFDVSPVNYSDSDETFHMYVHIHKT